MNPIGNKQIHLVLTSGYLYIDTMGEITEFTKSIQLFLNNYPWRCIDPVPWTQPGKPLAECRLALVSSAGFILPGQESFGNARRGGDVSFRQIPSDVDVTTLIDSHNSNSFDHSGMHQDPNIAFPIERVRELEKAGRIGCINHRHLSLMGSITTPGKLVKHTAPQAAQRLVDDGVDIALLIPV